MKKLFVIAMIIAINALITPNVNAKNQKGVYMTAKDYMDQKMTYKTNAKMHVNNSVWELPYITVIDSNKKIKLNKAKIFAYADGDKVYRFYKNEPYQIVEAAPITIYVFNEHVAQSKGYKIKQTYYFSTSPDGTMIPLTISNVKQAYRSNDRFLDLLDQYFSNGDVTAYDAVHHSYKLNYVYNKTLVK